MKQTFSLREFLSGSSTFIYTSEKNYTYDNTLSITESFRKFISEQNDSISCAALKSSNSAEMIFTLFALWSLRITPILLNTRLTKTETEETLNITGCSYLIDDDIIKSIPHEEREYTDSDINLNDTAVIIFTSGSTGRPKGVELTFSTLIEAAGLQSRYLDQEDGDKWLASLPFYHIGGFSMITRALFNKASLIIPRSLKIEDLISAIENFKPCYFSLVGTQLRNILDSDYKPGYKIKNILIGGGFTDEKIISEALKKGWPISKVYGSTETAAFITAAGIEDIRRYPDTAGKELVKGSVLILDTNQESLPNGNEGEIALKNVLVMKGYLNDIVSTSERFSQGYFMTKDIGYLNDEGFLFLVMRREDLIVSGGENINPKEIENALREVEVITDAYVFAMADEKWGQIAAAAVSSSKELTEIEIKNCLAGNLADFKIPKRFYFVDHIPRNELGKINLGRLNQLLDAQKV
jgi:o-succinylbenzoate---CoA ligase